MPIRLIRDGINSSETVNQLTWAEEVFYRRLLSVADDYGLYDARDVILRAALYPLRLDRISNRDIQKWHARCEALGLIKVYEVDGRRYGQIAKYGQQSKSAPKYPLPPGANPADYRPKDKKNKQDNTNRNEPLRAVTIRHLDEVEDVVVNKNKLVGSSTVCVGYAANQPPPPASIGQDEPQRFAPWLAAICAAHPSLRQSCKLAPAVLQSAKAAFERCPQAAEYASLLTAYFEDRRLKQDSNRERFWRPAGQCLFLDNLEDVIFSHALRWAREAGWGKMRHKSKKASESPKVPDNASSVATEEEKRACVEELKRGL